MLKKLIKYDILADWKKYCLLFGATIFLSITLLILDTSFDRIRTDENGYDLLATVLGASLGMLFIGIIFVTFVLIYILALVRFYKNIVRDEGYLMHTLPVPTWKLLASKLITYYIWVAGAVLTVLISIFIANNPAHVIEFIREGGVAEIIKEIKEEMGAIGFSFFGITAVLILIAPISQMAECFFCFAIGNLSNSHKLAMSVLTYIGISVGMNIISSVISTVMTFTRFSRIESNPTEYDISSYLTNSMTFALVFALVLTSGFLIAAERIFSKKLNLE